MASNDSLTQPRAPEVQLPVKKRRRPPLACQPCRDRKIRCDRKQPCSHCVKATARECTYVSTHTQPPPSRRTRSSSKPSVRPAIPEMDRPSYALMPVRSSPSTAPASTPASASDPPGVERLLARVHELEDQLSRSVSLDLDHAAVDQRRPHGRLPSRSNAYMSKTRYFSESHWMSLAELLPLQLRLHARMERDNDEPYQILFRIKMLSRKIKQSRVRHLDSSRLGETIPDRPMCDALVAIYLRLFEGFLRIVHVPSFLAEYERFWADRGAASPAFVMQLQLCMALGSALYDETFTLRARATQWLLEAHMWFILPPAKGRMTLTGLQNLCLLVLAKDVCASSQLLTWATTGDLVRKAMNMGLHRDPTQLGCMTRYTAEMRRRLWATILELNLQSMDAGGPPLLSGEDYDTLPPSNLDDEQLVDGDASSPGCPGEPLSEQPIGVPTKTSVLIALARSLPLRTAILKHVNGLQAFDSYEETLRLHGRMAQASRVLSAGLASLASKTRPGLPPAVTSSHVFMAEMCMFRSLHALHQPVVLRHFDDPQYYFSRKTQLDLAAQILHRLGLLERPWADAGAAADFNRLCSNGSGMWRIMPMQAAVNIVIELVRHSEEQTDSLGCAAPMGHAQLYQSAELVREWNLQRIVSGETNAKGYVFFAACLAHINALRQGKSLAGIEASIYDATVSAAGEALGAMERLAQREGVAMDDDAPNSPAFDALSTTDLISWMGDLAWGGLSPQGSWSRWRDGLADDGGVAMVAAGN